MQSVRDVINNDFREIYEGLSSQRDKLLNSKVFITGGSGFLGYYFIQFLLWMNDNKDAKCEITCLDNFIRGVPVWMKELESRNDLKLIKDSITDFDMNTLDGADYIIHAASIASPKYYRKYPIETMDANVDGLRSILEFCKNKKDSLIPVKSLLFFSSSEIYGDPTPDAIPTKEDYRGFVSCTGPRACYDESKRYGETLCVNFHNIHETPVKIARPFNNYGPGLKLDDARVIPDFFTNYFKNEDIVLLSDGSPKRTFCYISDAICGYLLTLLSEENGEPFNIGNPTPEISMKDLADMILRIGKEKFGGEDLKVVTGESEESNYLTDNPVRRCPDISKAKTLLNYKPSVSLEEGLKRTLYWYKSYYSL